MSCPQNELDRDARALHRAVTDMIRAYRFQDRNAICGYDISAAQSHGLERLAACGPLTMSQFAASLFLDRSSATRLADGLEEKGYVLRQPDPTDRRSVRLALTEEGRELFSNVERDLLAERRELLAGLGAGERAAVVNAITKLAQLVVRRCGRGDAARGCEPEDP